MSEAVAPDKLKSLVERIENLEDEKGGVSDQIKVVYAEAKGEGFDVKIMRQVVKLRRMKPHARAEQDELLELYRSAIGV